MNRREFVATAGTLLFAGCSGESMEETMQSPTATSTATLTPTATATPTSIPTDTPADTPTESSTETPEPTPSDEARQAAEHISNAEEHFGIIKAEFTKAYSTDRVTITRSDFYSDPPSGETVRWEVIYANRELDEAASLANDEQQEQISRLRQLAEFLDYAALAQRSLARAYQSAREIRTGLWDGNGTKVSNETGNLEEHLGEAKSALGDLPTLGGREGATTEHFEQSGLDGKVSQLTAARDTLQQLQPVFDQLRDAFEAYRTALNDEEPVDNYYTASIGFEEAQLDLEGLESPDSLASFVSDLQCETRAMARGSGYREDAAQAERDGDDGKAETARERARDALDSC